MKGSGKSPGVTGKKSGGGPWGNRPGKITPGKGGKGTGKFMPGGGKSGKSSKMGCSSCGSM